MTDPLLGLRGQNEENPALLAEEQEITSWISQPRRVLDNVRLAPVTVVPAPRLNLEHQLLFFLHPSAEEAKTTNKRQKNWLSSRLWLRALMERLRRPVDMNVNKLSRWGGFS